MLWVPELEVPPKTGLLKPPDPQPRMVTPRDRAMGDNKSKETSVRFIIPLGRTDGLRLLAL